MLNKNTLIGCRVFFALLGFSAIVTEVATLVSRGRFLPANFFSFFTIESNLLAVVVLIVSALALAAGKQGKRLAMLRGANTMNMIIVGVVFLFLLSGIKDVEFTAVPWDNIVLHYIMPVVVALDWLVDTPKNRIAFRQALVWLMLPVAYVVYSLVRGHFVGWYPYPFLNPGTKGYVNVAMTSVVLMFGAAGLVWALAWSTRRSR